MWGALLVVELHKMDIEFRNLTSDRKYKSSSLNKVPCKFVCSASYNYASHLGPFHFHISLI
jgi:hypothetical protein